MADGDPPFRQAPMRADSPTMEGSSVRASSGDGSFRAVLSPGSLNTSGSSVSSLDNGRHQGSSPPPFAVEGKGRKPSETDYHTTRVGRSVMDPKYLSMTPPLLNTQGLNDLYDRRTAFRNRRDSCASSILVVDINQPDGGIISGTPRVDSHGPSNTVLRRRRKWKLQIIGICWLMLCLAMGLASDYYQDVVPGTVIWGVVLTLTLSSVVSCSYIFQPKSRCHPNHLVMYHNICAYLFAAKVLFVLLFICTGEAEGCQGLTKKGCLLNIMVEMFLLVAGEMWFLVAVIDLRLTVTNPFTNWSANSRKYHVFVWSISGLASILGVVAVNQYPGLGPCDVVHVLSATGTIKGLPLAVVWAKDNSMFWTLFMLWIAGVIIVSAIFLLLSWHNTRGGLSSVSKVRRRAISHAAYYVIVTQIFWIGFFVASIIVLAQERDGTSLLYRIFSFFLVGKGYLSYTAWWFSIDPKGWNFALSTSKDYQPDYTPQTNGPLRRELLYYTLNGVKLALLASTNLTADASINEVFVSTKNVPLTDAQILRLSAIEPAMDDTRGGSEVLASPSEEPMAANFHDDLDILDPSSSKRFLDFHPFEFRRIRALFNIDDVTYLRSLSRAKKAKLSEGASGAFMFYSGDGKLIVKSCSEEERKHLLSMIKDYADHVKAHRDTFITRFYGCHSIFLYSQSFSFVVMANIFALPKTIHTRYDMKGSWVNRYARRPKSGQMVTCRFCNAKYKYEREMDARMAFREEARPFSSNVNANVNPNELRLSELTDTIDATFDDRDPSPCTNPRGHHPNIVLKDNDFASRDPLKLSNTTAAFLHDQLKHDSDFLYAHGIMDYSLLIGVHNENYGSQAESFITLRDSFRSSGEQTRGRAFTHTDMWGMGPEYYSFGLIDVLQTWTYHKRYERFFKTQILRQDAKGISAINPTHYKERFQASLAKLFVQDPNEILSLEERKGSVQVPSSGSGEDTSTSTNSSLLEAGGAFKPITLMLGADGVKEEVVRLPSASNSPGTAGAAPAHIQVLAPQAPEATSDSQAQPLAN